MSDLIHSQSQLKPRYIPYLGDVDWSQIDRVQTLDPSGDFPKEKDEEVGTAGVLGWSDDVPAIGCRLTQREYGSIDFFNLLANKSGETVLTLDDFAASAGDILTYLTDRSGSYKGTLWYPKQRLTGFSIAVGDPTSRVDRSFEFTGEDAILWQSNNKYLIFKKTTVGSGDLASADAVNITVSNPVAVTDPDTGSYILRVTRVRSGETTELVENTDYSYSAGVLTVDSCQIDDVIKYYYSASAWVTSPISPFITNTSDLNSIRAHSVVPYLGVGNRLYKLQSANIDVRFDREDVREIGNKDVIARSITNKTVSIDLGKLLDTEFSLLELLRGQSSGYGKIDVKEFSKTLNFILAVYSNSGHGTFKIGYKATTLAVTTHRPGTANIDTNVDSGVTLEGEALTISNDAGELGLS